jgi:hypothetical protein
MIESRLSCIIGFELPPGAAGSSTGSFVPPESTRYSGRSLPPPNRIGTRTTFSGTGADDGSVCKSFEEGVALTLGVAEGVADAGVGLGVAETLGEAVVLLM